MTTFNVNPKRRETVTYVSEGTTTCPDCGQTFGVELVDNGVAYIWHGVCCGWGRQVHSDDVATPAGTRPAPERMC